MPKRKEIPRLPRVRGVVVLSLVLQDTEHSHLCARAEDQCTCISMSLRGCVVFVSPAPPYDAEDERALETSTQLHELKHKLATLGATLAATLTSEVTHVVVVVFCEKKGSASPRADADTVVAERHQRLSSTCGDTVNLVISYTRKKSADAMHEESNRAHDDRRPCSNSQHFVICSVVASRRRAVGEGGREEVTGQTYTTTPLPARHELTRGRGKENPFSLTHIASAPRPPRTSQTTTAKPSQRGIWRSTWRISARVPFTV